jgi:hypothetical protein
MYQMSSEPITISLRITPPETRSLGYEVVCLRHHRCMLMTYPTQNVASPPKKLVQIQHSKWEGNSSEGGRSTGELYLSTNISFLGKTDCRYSQSYVIGKNTVGTARGKYERMSLTVVARPNLRYSLGRHRTIR